MYTEFACGMLSRYVRFGLLTGCNSRRNPPIEYFGSNCEFLNCMTYNDIGRKYVS